MKKNDGNAPWTTLNRTEHRSIYTLCIFCRNNIFFLLALHFARAFAFDLFNYSSFTLSIYSDCRAPHQFRIPNVNRHFIIDTFYIPNVIQPKMLLVPRQRRQTMRMQKMKRDGKGKRVWCQQNSCSQKSNGLYIATAIVYRLVIM